VVEVPNKEAVSVAKKKNKRHMAEHGLMIEIVKALIKRKVSAHWAETVLRIQVIAAAIAG
jgi:hypothetical protein